MSYNSLINPTAQELPSRRHSTVPRSIASSRAAPYTTYSNPRRELIAPSNSNSYYRHINSQPTAPTMERRDVFGLRIRAATSASHYVPVNIASALASWNIPQTSWIHYYNGTYAWPAGLSVQGPRFSQQEQSSGPVASSQRRATSTMTTSPLPSSVDSIFVDRVQNGRNIIPCGHASINRSRTLRSQRAAQPLIRPIGAHEAPSYISNGFEVMKPRHTNLNFFSREISPPPGFENAKAIDGKIRDLRAIVNFIVPAGGLDPKINYGIFECLKYTSVEANEDVEHFVRDSEAWDPDFQSMLAGFATVRKPGVYQGATPTDEYARKDMYARGYIRYEGQWTKIADLNEHRRKLQEAKNQAAQEQQQQAVCANPPQPHPVQLGDEQTYLEEYRHAEVDDDCSQGFEYDEDFCVVGVVKGGVSKKGSPKNLKGYGTIRRRSSSSKKSKKQTKEQKMDRGSKEDKNRSCCDFF